MYWMTVPFSQQPVPGVRRGGMDPGPTTYTNFAIGGAVGGAVGGALFGLILPIGIRGRQALRPFFNVLGTICVVATIASILMMVSSWIF